MAIHKDGAFGDFIQTTRKVLHGDQQCAGNDSPAGLAGGPNIDQDKVVGILEELEALRYGSFLK